MQVQPRVLGYIKAKELKEEELLEVSGGAAKPSVNHIQRGTGHPPGPVDVEIIQVWD